MDTSSGKSRSSWTDEYGWVFPVAILAGVAITGYALVAWAEKPSASAGGGGGGGGLGGILSTATFGIL